jgi:hypothetical protein
MVAEYRVRNDAYLQSAGSSGALESTEMYRSKTVLGLKLGARRSGFAETGSDQNMQVYLEDIKNIYDSSGQLVCRCTNQYQYPTYSYQSFGTSFSHVSQAG